MEKNAPFIEKIEKENPSFWEDGNKKDISLKNIGKEFGIKAVGVPKINLMKRYIDDIFEICPLCKVKRDTREHAINECIETENERKELLEK